MEPVQWTTDPDLPAIPAGFHETSLAAVSEFQTYQECFAFFHPADTIAAMKSLKARGQDINQNLGNYLDTVLLAALDSSPHVVIQWLLDNGADPNQYYNNCTPLMKAAQRDSVPVSCMAQLVRRGARVGSDQALHYAVGRLSVAKVLLLLEHGANPNRTDSQCIPMGNRDHGITPLHMAATLNPTLRKCNCVTVQRDLEEIVRLLLLYGADPTVLDGNGKNAATVAGMHGNRRIVDMIHSHLREVDVKDGKVPDPVLSSARLSSTEVVPSVEKACD